MNGSFLTSIVEHTRYRIEKAKGEISLAEIKEKALNCPASIDFPFEKALSQECLSIICECKKASPSKGIIADDFPYLQIAKEYEAAGAAAISVLTEPKWFMGKNEFLSEIAANVSIPCLRKDFVIDEYMIYEAKILGSSAVLLICALLDAEVLKDYISLCDLLGLSALVEVHDESEIVPAVNAGARIIGVNNRNLDDFSVDIMNSERLRTYVPKNILFVAESGIKTASDIAGLREKGVDAVLIGEALMKASDKKIALQALCTGGGNL